MAITPVQSVLSLNSNTTITGVDTFSTPAFGAALTAGNAVCGAFTFVSAGFTTMGAISDGSNTYTQSPIVRQTTDGNCVVMFYLFNIAGGQTIITANWDGTNQFQYCRITATEFSGIATASALDVALAAAAVQSGVANTTDLIKSNSITTVTNGDLLYGASIQTDTNTGINAGSTYTSLIYGADADVVPMRAEYLIQGTAGASTTANFTGVAATHNYMSGIIALKAAGGAQTNQSLILTSGTFQTVTRTVG